MPVLLLSTLITVFRSMHHGRISSSSSSSSSISRNRAYKGSIIKIIVTFSIDRVFVVSTPDTDLSFFKVACTSHCVHPDMFFLTKVTSIHVSGTPFEMTFWFCSFINTLFMIVNHSFATLSAIRMFPRFKVIFVISSFLPFTDFTTLVFTIISKYHAFVVSFSPLTRTFVF